MFGSYHRPDQRQTPTERQPCSDVLRSFCWIHSHQLRHDLVGSRRRASAKNRGKSTNTAKADNVCNLDNIRIRQESTSYIGNRYNTSVRRVAYPLKTAHTL